MIEWEVKVNTGRSAWHNNAYLDVIVSIVDLDHSTLSRVLFWYVRHAGKLNGVGYSIIVVVWRHEACSGLNEWTN